VHTARSSCDSRLGQLDLLYWGCFTESNPRCRPFVGCSRAHSCCRSSGSGQLAHFIQVLLRSQTRHSVLSCLSRPSSLGDSGTQATCPTLPGHPSESSSRLVLPTRRRFATLVPVVVLQSAQDRSRLKWFWVPVSGRPLLRVSPSPRPAPLKAQRTLRGRFGRVNSAPSDRPHPWWHAPRRPLRPCVCRGE
jgi:hypothetical protein